MVTKLKPKTAVFIDKTVENRNQGFLEPCEQFSPRHFGKLLENAAYMQRVAHSIQG